MIRFAPLEKLPAAYWEVIYSDWHAAARRAHELFSHRFAPKALFARAAIYRDWQIGSHETPSNGTNAVIYDERRIADVSQQGLRTDGTLPRNPCTDTQT